MWNSQNVETFRSNGNQSVQIVFAKNSELFEVERTPTNSQFHVISEQGLYFVWNRTDTAKIMENHYFCSFNIKIILVNAFEVCLIGRESKNQAPVVNV